MSTDGNGHDREVYNPDEEVTKPGIPLPDYPRLLLSKVSDLCIEGAAFTKDLNEFRSELHAAATGGTLEITDRRRDGVGRVFGRFGDALIAAQDAVHPEGKRARARKRSAVG